MNPSITDTMLLRVLESAMDAIITIDQQQRIVLFNAAAQSIFRCPSKDALGASIDRFIPERFRSAHREHIERFGETGVTMRRMGSNVVLSGLRADGDEFPIEASISQATVDGEKFYTVILRDITERQRVAQELSRSNQRLRELYEAMHEVREAERTRIARELHDELAQWLTALKMDAAAIAGRLPPHDPLKDRVERMKKVVDTTVASVRRIASDLRPVMLDDLGIAAAIENLVHDFGERSGIAVELSICVGELQLGEPHATALYRMLQEALTNVARHAQATRVEIGLAVDDARLKVRVDDNGCGIAPEALEAKGSFGLLGIRERAHTLGGFARIFAGEQGGTTVEIALPLKGRDG